MQRLFELSGHPLWAIRGTGLTHYIKTYKNYLSYQDIPSEIRGMELTFYIKPCKDCLSDQNVSLEQSVVLDSQPILEHAKFV